MTERSFWAAASSVKGRGGFARKHRAGFLCLYRRNRQSTDPNTISPNREPFRLARRMPPSPAPGRSEFLLIRASRRSFFTSSSLFLPTPFQKTEHPDFPAHRHGSKNPSPFILIFPFHGRSLFFIAYRPPEHVKFHLSFQSTLTQDRTPESPLYACTKKAAYSSAAFPCLYLFSPSH